MCLAYKIVVVSRQFLNTYIDRRDNSCTLHSFQDGYKLSERTNNECECLMLNVRKMCNDYERNLLAVHSLSVYPFLQDRDPMDLFLSYSFYL